MVGIEVSGQQSIGRRIPHIVIEAVENAMNIVMAMAQQTVETRAACGCHDLARIRRADGVDHRGVIDTAGHEVDFAIGFFIEAAGQQLQVVEDVPAGVALMHQVMNREDGRDAAIVRIGLAGSR